MPTWEPAQYLRFDAERTRPCRDLAGRVELPAPRRIIDLGCGPGNSTAILAERWPSAEFTGLDRSAEMIAAAFTSDYLGLIRQAFPRHADGRVLFPFLRLFLIAYAEPAK